MSATKRINLLLIDDDLEDVLLLKETLAESSEQSFHVIHTGWLKTGLDCLAKGEIDLVILDLNLPDSRGLDTLRTLLSQTNQVPIVVMSELTDETLALATIQMGAQDYLVKGRTDEKIIVHIIRYAIERHRLYQNLHDTEARTRLIIKNNVDSILIVDCEGVMRFVNPSAETLFGRPAEQLIGAAFGFPVITDKVSELEIRRPDGSTRVTEMRAAEITWNARLAYLTSLRDITERKQAERQILKQLETLGALYDLSRALAETDDFNTLMDLLTRRTVEATHVTFARVLLLENGDLVTQAGFPVRLLDHDLQVGQREPLAAHSFLQRVMEENIPRVFRLDSPEGNEFIPFFLGIAKTLCVVPLHARDQPLGVLMLGEERDVERESFTADKIRLASSIGDQASSSLHRALLHEETQRRLRNIQALRDIEHAINSNLDLRLTLSIVLEQVVKQLDVDAADIQLLNPSAQTMEYTAGRGFRNKDIEHSRIRLAESHSGNKREWNLVSVNQERKEIKGFIRGDSLAGEDFDCYRCTPLVAKGQVKGMLEVYLHTRRPLDAEWSDLFETLAGQIAIAVNNASLLDDLQRSNVELSMAYDATIEGWSRALDLRDCETEGHSQRVTEITLKIARTLDMSDEQLVHVRRGALLHDIGKMGVPDSILLKPSQLDDAEWKIMRKHPRLGFDMLSPIYYLRPALDIPYCHHEKWDGSGYPRGLKGEEIPLAARLFAVVDVYDALTSDRPYRKAWPKEKTRQYIHEQSGRHFDPLVASVFLKMFDEGL